MQKVAVLLAVRAWTGVLSWGAFLLLVGLVGWLGSFQVPSADDYSALIHTREAVWPWQYVVGRYMAVTGRVFSLAAMALTLRSFDFLPLVSAVLGSAFVLSGPLVVISLSRLALFRGSRLLSGGSGRSLAGAGFFVVTAATGLCIAFREFYAQCVYWPVGGLVYSFSLVCALVWLSFLLALAAGRWRPHPALFWGIWLPLCLFVGTAHEQISAAILALLFCRWLFRFVLAGPKSGMVASAVPKVWMSVIAFCLGTAVLLAAPGNFARAAMVPGSLPTDLAGLIDGAAAVAPLFFRFAPEPAMFGLLSGLVSGAVATVPGLVARRRGLIALAASALAASVAAELPMLAVSKLAWIRTNYVSMVFLYGAMFLFGYACARALRGFWHRGRVPLYVTACLVETALLGALVAAIAAQIPAASSFKREVLARHEQLLKERKPGGRSHQVAFLSPLRNPPPPFLNFIDATADPAYYVNDRMARFYGYRAVVLRPRRGD